MLERGIIPDTLPGHLPELATLLEQRIKNIGTLLSHEQPAWIQALGEVIARIKPPERGKASQAEEAQAEHDQINGLRLARTIWHPVASLEVEPFIERQPAGQARAIKALWQDTNLYVVLPGPKNHRELVEAILSQIERQDVRQAIIDCIGRDSRWIGDYFEENFELVEEIPTPRPPVPPPAPAGPGRIPPIPVPPRPGPPEPPAPPVPPVAESGPKPPRGPGIQKERIDAFMHSLGFEWQAHLGYYTDRFGNLMKRTQPPFQWCKFTFDGKTCEYYWFADKSLADGVEIPAELWEVMKRDPDHSWMISPVPDGTLLVLTWSDISKLVQQGNIELFTSEYRLRATGRIAV